MEFNYTDALILQSIWPEPGIGLETIIGYVDYINHAVLTYSEFSSSIEKLLYIGVVVVQPDQKLALATDYKEWYKNLFGSKKRMSHKKIMEKIEEYLKASFSTIELSKRKLSLYITQDDFAKTVEAYQKSWEKKK